MNDVTMTTSRRQSVAPITVEQLGKALAGQIWSRTYLAREMSESKTTAQAAELILRRRVMNDPRSIDVPAMLDMADQLEVYARRLTNAISALEVNDLIGIERP